MRALIIGGTKGIGLALKEQLESSGWTAIATGREDFDIGYPSTYWDWAKTQKHPFDLIVFAAGILDPQRWNEKTWDDYRYSYRVHALGPVYFLANFGQLIAKGANIAFITSTGAENSGILDLGYGMAKAALDKAYKALKANTDLNVHLVRFDLVDTDMMQKNPKDALEGREIITVEQAAEEIMKCLE